MSKLNRVSAVNETAESKGNVASAFCDDALGKGDALEIAQRISRGEISSEEAADAAIERAKYINPTINAMVSERFELARQQSQSTGAGIFSGVPTFIKDNDDVKGMATRNGSQATSTVAASESSPFVKQMESSGLIILGKSSLPEFGFTGTTEPKLTGASANPWNTDYSTGGSSGGAAALVAAGVVPIAHANDGGGSTRIPAACCGLVGLKPSRGRLLNIPAADKLPVNVAAQGVVTRSVRDTAAFYAASEQYYRNPALPAIGQVKHPGEKRLRMGVFVNRANASVVDFDCASATLEAAKLCEQLGHKVETIESPFPQQIMDDFFHYWSFMAFATHRFGNKFLGDEFQGNKLDTWTKGLSSNFAKRMWRLPLCIRRLRKFQQDYENVFKQYDILISPTNAITTPKLGHIGPDVPFDTAYERVREFVFTTPFQNVSGAPAISLPMGMSANGLPIGIQFASAMGGERLLLELALELEEAQPWLSLAK